MNHGIQLGIIEFKDLRLEADYEPFAWRCARWLEDEGFLTAREIEFAQGVPLLMSQPALTAYGLSVLGSSVDLNGSPIEIKEIVREVDRSEEVAFLGGRFFGSLLGSFIKSAG